MTPLKRPVHILARILLATTCLVGLAPLANAEVDGTGRLPRPAALAHDVDFWVQIYSEVTTRGGLIHDSRHLEVIYEQVTVPSGARGKARERFTDKIKAKYRKVLTKLATGKRTGLTAEEARILALWPEDVTNSDLRKAKSRLRFQLGQADKFKAGVVRSGRWKQHIEKVFAEHGLPKELTALPHVESSFTPWAYSRVGAAGLWQFTRSTGRRFLRVDNVIDERLDPHRATVAAARLLSQNREVTGTWPLAITAYNHGASGMRRAARKLGTKDIVTINRKYKSRTFGFASRNFYVELLAASEVSTNYEKYFGHLILDAPEDILTFEVPFYTKPGTLAKALGIDKKTFKEANPSLRPSVFSGAKYIPRRFPLHVKRGDLERPIADAINQIPASQRYAAQTRDVNYRVARGDTLSKIARRFKVSMSELVAINGLRSRHKIRVGQRLKLPSDGRTHRPRTITVTQADIPNSGQYTVRRGDTVTRIAKRFGIEEAQILEVNNLRNRNRIYVGQSLTLLADDTVPASPKLATTKGASVSKSKAAAPKAPSKSKTSPHPDAVATLSNPPERPAESHEPVHSTSLTETDVEGLDVDAPAVAMLDGDHLQNLLADPSDYGVGSNSTIEVQGAETLGHYAEWLDIRASRLRTVNRLPYNRMIAIGQRVKLDFSEVDATVFEARRQQYHRMIQEAFFERYEIEGTVTHVARRGDSVWSLSEKKYHVPLWLLRQYNPDLDFASLQRGTPIKIPALKERENWVSQQVESRTS
ncbi:MAG TPA: LysM peptidoglycan-binding domain-containing protein [Myxococcales bacterium]|nr:LysM peptidoglycan-binding domain-containing protein [Myxococcales bacterium]HIM00001.1 LysM peptidoglycan-binding domain-containing protein [Myxococcales bacterium]